jgi:hypothetical protein
MAENKYHCQKNNKYGKKMKEESEENQFEIKGRPALSFLGVNTS